MTIRCRMCGNIEGHDGECPCAVKVGLSHPQADQARGQSSTAALAKASLEQQRQPTKREPGSPAFLAILATMRELHIKKDQDYAGDAKAFDNFRSASEIGIRPSTGAFIRLQDKFKRIQNLLRRETKGIGAAVQDESIEDTLMDLASYALIVLVLRQEEK